MHRHFSHPVDWAALARYLSNESEPGEAEAVRRWIEAAPDRGVMVERLQRVWAEAAVPRQEWDTEAAVRWIMDATPVVSIASRRRTVRRWIGWVGAAAAVAVLAVGLTMWRPALIRSLPTAIWGTQEYRTARGQSTTLVLNDGVRITLAPMSRLRVPRSFGDPVQSVYLEGQAFFEVTHDASRTFQVRTARAITKDLGTRFVVRAYAEAPVDEVMVTEGVVAVTPQSSTSKVAAATPLLLHAGELGRVGPDGTLQAEHGVDTASYTAWTQGRLVFRRTPLRDMAIELARWYDLEVRIPDSATADRRVTVTFDGQPAADVLRYVALSLGLRYEDQGQTVTLTPKIGPDQREP